MPQSLSELSIKNCMLATDSFSNGLPHLKRLSIFGCRSSTSLSIGHLTSLESLELGHIPDLCFLEGLFSLQLHAILLTDIPKLTVDCISQFRVQKSLNVSSSVLLNQMLSAEGFTVPASICLIDCKETYVSFGGSANFSSVKHLAIFHCEMKCLAANLSTFAYGAVSSRRRAAEHLMEKAGQRLPIPAGRNSDEGCFRFASRRKLKVKAASRSVPCNDILSVACYKVVVECLNLIHLPLPSVFAGGVGWLLLIFSLIT